MKTIFLSMSFIQNWFMRIYFERMLLSCLTVSLCLLSASVVYAQDCKASLEQLQRLPIGNLTNLSNELPVKAKISVVIKSTGVGSPTVSIVKKAVPGAIELDLPSSLVSGASLRPINNFYSDAKSELEALIKQRQLTLDECSKVVSAPPAPAALTQISPIIAKKDLDSNAEKKGTSQQSDNTIGGGLVLILSVAIFLLACLIGVISILAWPLRKLPEKFNSLAEHIAEITKATNHKDVVIDEIRTRLDGLSTFRGLAVDARKTAIDTPISPMSLEPTAASSNSYTTPSHQKNSIPTSSNTTPTAFVSRSSENTSSTDYQNNLRQWICGEFQAWLDTCSLTSTPSAIEPPKFNDRAMKVCYFNLKKTVAQGGEWQGAMVLTSVPDRFYAVLTRQSRIGTSTEQEWIDYPSGLGSSHAYHDDSQWCVKEPALVSLDKNNQISIINKSKLERRR